MEWGGRVLLCSLEGRDEALDLFEKAPDAFCEGVDRAFEALEKADAEHVGEVGFAFDAFVKVVFKVEVSGVGF